MKLRCLILPVNSTNGHVFPAEREGERVPGGLLVHATANLGDRMFASSDCSASPWVCVSCDCDSSVWSFAGSATWDPIEWLWWMPPPQAAVVVPMAPPAVSDLNF